MLTNPPRHDASHDLYQPVTVPANPPRTLALGDLMQGGREVIIDHNGCAYRLRLTQHDRLILTK